jgi:uncharacterized protein (TIGR00730 family)
MKRICVFCGSSSGSRHEHRAATEELGTELARRNIGLVYGGGNVGLMGVLADAVLKAGGEAQGVIPEHLMAREIGHNGLTKLHIVHSMHERKALMADLSDAFIALPGGFGTLEEFCEIVTWAQLGLHAKPCGILNVLGYYSPLLAMLDHAVEERFLKPENRYWFWHGSRLWICCGLWRSGVRFEWRNGWIGRRVEGRNQRSPSGRCLPACDAMSDTVISSNNGRVELQPPQTIRVFAIQRLAGGVESRSRTLSVHRSIGLPLRTPRRCDSPRPPKGLASVRSRRQRLLSRERR